MTTAIKSAQRLFCEIEEAACQAKAQLSGMQTYERDC
jgi:hypothetical protein